MSKAEEEANKRYCVTRGDDTEETSGIDMQRALDFIDGYHQAGKDIIENKHEKSWRLDKQLWKGIKEIEKASYQYIYDASNDWAYDVPTWEDVQDAFKAGADWKENPELTWKDIADILNITDVIANDDSMEEHLKKMSEEEYCKEVLKRYKESKNVK